MKQLIKKGYLYRDSNGPRAIRVIEQGNSISPRPEVQWFTERMEETLRANDHKTGWADCSADWLANQMHKKLMTLWQLSDPETIVTLAADIANYSMMVADNARRQKEANK